MFRRFGSTVTVVQHGKQLLAREGPEVAEEVLKVLQEDGIEVLIQTEATRVQAVDRRVVLQLHGPAGGPNRRRIAPPRCRGTGAE
jgi:pyruvate/2-oxoglutarate dehydrogenase complex dihydrolipoamide dehydrogenase (E3) component